MVTYMKSFERSCAAASLALVAALGASGCGGSEKPAGSKPEPTAATNPNSCEHPKPLQEVHRTFATRKGDIKLVNDGPCAAIYSRVTRGTVGDIGHKATFVVICNDERDNAFQVMGEGAEATGLVDYSASLINAHISHQLATKGIIPICK